MAEINKFTKLAELLFRVADDEYFNHDTYVQFNLLEREVKTFYPALARARNELDEYYVDWEHASRHCAADQERRSLFRELAAEIQNLQEHANVQRTPP